MNAAFWTILFTYAAVYTLNVVWLSPEKRSVKELAGVAAWSVVSSCLSYAAWCGILAAFRHLSHVTVDVATLETLAQLAPALLIAGAGFYLNTVMIPGFEEAKRREIESERRKIYELNQLLEQQRQEQVERMERLREEILLRTGRKSPDS